MTESGVVRGAPTSGWGRYPVATTDLVRPERMSTLHGLLEGNRTLIPRGMGRCYGDAAQNGDGATVLMGRLNRMLAFDADSGVLDAEAGVTIQDLLDVFLPRGFAPPVTPGTRFVTLGGCLACDVHGKNHHKSGSFSRHVLDFTLLLPDHTTTVCSRTEDPELFWATVGGMGLTGIVTSLRLRLKPVATSYLSVDVEKARSLTEALDLFRASDESYEYSVAWIDCLAGGEGAGRSVLMRGNDAAEGAVAGRRPRHPRGGGPAVPFDAPSGLLNRLSVGLFNEIYYRKAPRKATARIQSYDTFFYPLDGIRNWNRIYGRRGFVQYQFVVPPDGAESALRTVLDRIARAGEASFLAVLKSMGPAEDGQMLSFPRRGYTLAVDIPWRGTPTAGLLDELDVIVVAHGGRVYLAKDARMTRETFRAMYPGAEAWSEIKRRVDPAGRFRSDLAVRLGLVP
jgi:decaprenylphospho-beta-D-ribofuranose 2-oxidase